jgi:hypothetical protein
MAHKYDQRLSKCVGIMIAKDREHFDILWCLISHPWVEDSELQQRLDRSFPFRPVKPSVEHSYRFVDG